MMSRSTLQWLSLTTAMALIATGCVARPPAARPTPNRGGVPGQAAGLVPGSMGSTTGDADGCASALGNMMGAPTTAAMDMEVTANGIMIGNVALVGLPTADDLPLSPGTVTVPGGGTWGAPRMGATPAPGGVTAPGGPAMTAPRMGGTAAAPGGTAVAPGGTTAAPGGTTVTGPVGRTAGTANLSAVDRIRAYCRGVSEIRVVTDAADRARLGEVAQAIRHGQPITNFMEDMARIARKATVHAGAMSGAAPGSAPGLVPGGVPGGVPRMTPGVTPGVAPGVTPGAPGVTPRTTPMAPPGRPTTPALP